MMLEEWLVTDVDIECDLNDRELNDLSSIIFLDNLINFFTMHNMNLKKNIEMSKIIMIRQLKTITS